MIDYHFSHFQKTLYKKDSDRTVGRVFFGQTVTNQTRQMSTSEELAI